MYKPFQIVLVQCSVADKTLQERISPAPFAVRRKIITYLESGQTIIIIRRRRGGKLLRKNNSVHSDGLKKKKKKI